MNHHWWSWWHHCHCVQFCTHCFKPKEAQVQINLQLNPHYLCFTIQLQKHLHWQRNPCSYKPDQGASPAAGRNISMIIVPNACWRHTKFIVWHLKLHQAHCLARFLPHPSAWIPPKLALSSYGSLAKTQLNSKLGSFLSVPVISPESFENQLSVCLKCFCPS